MNMPEDVALSEGSADATRTARSLTYRIEEPRRAPEARSGSVVLVIDDDDWIRGVMTEVLESDGFSVLEASNGVRGLEVAEQRGPDVILLDLALPGRSGIDVLKRLKERQPTREIPVIIVSAYALLLLRGDLQRADGVLQKPFDLADLLSRVRAAARPARANPQV